MTKEERQDCSKLVNFFIKKSKSGNLTLYHDKLQTLVFCGYGWILAVLNQNLLGNTNRFNVIGSNIVFEPVYHEFKNFKRKPIDSLSLHFPDDRGINGQFLEFCNIDCKEKEIVIVLNRVWEVYGKYISKSLSEYLYKELVKVLPKPSKYIDTNTVKRYFVKEINMIFN